MSFRASIFFVATAVLIFGSFFSSKVFANSQSPFLLAQASTVAAPLGQSTTTMTEAIPQTARPKIGYNILSYNFMSESQANRSEGEVSSINTLRANITIDEKSSVRLNQDVLNNWVNNSETRTGKFTFLDPYVMYARNDLLKLESGMSVNGFARYYIPISANSQRANTGGAIRLGAEVAQRFVENKLLVAYNVIPQLNILNQTSFLNAEGKLQGSRQSSLLHYAEVAYDIRPNLTVYTDLGLRHVDYIQDTRIKDRTGKDHSYLYANIGLIYTPISFFEVEVGLNEDESRDLTEDNSYFAVYREEDTNYYLQGRFMF